MRNAKHLKITLHEAILSRSSVLHDICVIKLHLFTIDLNRKVSLIDFWTWIQNHSVLTSLSVCLEHPAAESGENFINIESVSINLRSGELAASHRDFPLGRITSVNNCYTIQIHIYPFLLHMHRPLPRPPR